MQRRDVLKRIGASSAVAVGAAGVGTAGDLDAFAASTEIGAEEANFLATRIDGELRKFTFEEFEGHPDTPSLADVDLSACCYECCECCDACCPDQACCCAGDCGSCPGC